MSALVQMLSPSIKAHVVTAGRMPLLLYCLLRQQLSSVGALSPQSVSASKSNEFIQVSYLSILRFRIIFIVRGLLIFFLQSPSPLFIVS